MCNWSVYWWKKSCTLVTGLLGICLPMCFISPAKMSGFENVAFVAGMYSLGIFNLHFLHMCQAGILCLV